MIVEVRKELWREDADGENVVVPVEADGIVWEGNSVEITRLTSNGQPVEVTAAEERLIESYLVDAADRLARELAIDEPAVWVPRWAAPGAT